nr:hypothetical protein [uncultured Rhodopila sp.]
MEKPYQSTIKTFPTIRFDKGLAEIEIFMQYVWPVQDYTVHDFLHTVGATGWIRAQTGLRHSQWLTAEPCHAARTPNRHL